MNKSDILEKLASVGFSPEEANEFIGWWNEAEVRKEQMIGGSDGKTKVIRLRVTPSEKDTIEAAAQAAGLTTSEYIRRTLLG